MKAFIVHTSDAKGIDEQTTVEVPDAYDVGRAAQIALDALVEKYGSDLTFPIFVDIHPTEEFLGREWMHESRQKASL
jgi:hypothetical protein